MKGFRWDGQKSLNGRVTLGFHWFKRLKARVVDPVVLNIDKIIPKKQPSTNVDSFKQESATILSLKFRKRVENALYSFPFPFQPVQEFTRKRVAIKESGCWFEPVPPHPL